MKTVCGTAFFTPSLLEVWYSGHSLLAPMHLSAQFKKNLPADHWYICVLSQPYAINQTRGDTEGMVSNPTLQGTDQREKKASNSSLIFVSLTNSACADSVENRSEREQSNKRETFEKGR